VVGIKSLIFSFSPGLYPIVGWKIGAETVYLAEGNAAGCGTAMEWARKMGGNFEWLTLLFYERKKLC